MTSNLGSEQIQQLSDAAQYDEMKAAVMTVVGGYFRPEFIFDFGRKSDLRDLPDHRYLASFGPAAYNYGFFLACTNGIGPYWTMGLTCPADLKNTKNIQNWDFSTFLFFYVQKDTPLDFFLQGVLESAVASCDLTLVHVNKRF